MGAASVCGSCASKAEAEDFERERVQLHAKIGQQAVELDWLTNLCAVMDWHSRKALGGALSNTMGSDLWLEALEKALNSTGKVSEIFNADQGCQFTSAEWTGRLTDLGVKISMDGKGRWMDKVFIERLWRGVK